MNKTLYCRSGQASFIIILTCFVTLAFYSITMAWMGPVPESASETVSESVSETVSETISASESATATASVSVPESISGQWTNASPEGFDHFHRQVLTVDDLLSWQRLGNGYFGNFRNRALQMTEDEHSDGLMLVSRKSFGTDLVVTCDVMTLRPATVLVLMLSASDGDGTGQLNIPAGFNGALSAWGAGAVDYFFAFHNAPHFRHPFVNRRGTNGPQLLMEADRNYMRPGQWHRVEIGRSGSRLWLRIDGKMVLDVIDETPLGAGHIAFRTVGSGTERASLFIKDVIIHTPTAP